ncbi:MAG: hypothetical protein WCQ99_15015, partial [Pseudomonadota bacterium]
SGTIWVDYSFFTKEFGFAALVGKNKKSDKNFNPTDNDTYVPPTGEEDLISYSAEVWKDVYPGYPNWYGLGYQVYNVGANPVLYTQRWSISLIYYSAYDANDYGIVAFDYFSDAYANGTNIASELGTDYSVLQAYNWQLNLPTGQGFTRIYDYATSTNTLFPFVLPGTLNGYYYLVLIADGFDSIAEYDEANNYYWTTTDPLYMVNGTPQSLQTGTSKARMSLRSLPVGKLQGAVNSTGLKQKHSNAYSPEEIGALIRHHKKTGMLAKKIVSFKDMPLNNRISVAPPQRKAFDTGLPGK